MREKSPSLLPKSCTENVPTPTKQEDSDRQGEDDGFLDTEAFLCELLSLLYHHFAIICRRSVHKSLLAAGLVSPH